MDKLTLLMSADNYELLYHEEHNLIEARWKGFVDDKTLKEFFEKSRGFLKKYAPVNYLNDGQELEDFSYPARLVGIKNIKAQRAFIRRSASVGGGSVLFKWMFNQVIRLSGREDIRLFETRNEAMTWLLAKEE